jgi:protein-tyrosine-phosphatase
MTTPSVLFLCVHNAGRSQMAAALLERESKRAITIYSAGSEPGETLNPAVVEVLNEIDIDISSQKPQKLTDQMALDADVIVTMGCGDACPVYPGKRYLDWELTDPAGRSVEEVRVIRDEIQTRVSDLARELLAANS